MDAAAVVIDSANLAVETVATTAFAKLTRQALRRSGATMARHVGENGVGLFAPVVVVQGGKVRRGAVLALEDRAVIGWTQGKLRLRNREAVIPVSSLRTVERTDGSAGSPVERAVLRLATDRESWALVFENVFDGGRSIVPLIHGVLTGTVRPMAEVDGPIE